MSEGLFNPDQPYRVHLRHPRFGKVSTACGGSLIFLCPIAANGLGDAWTVDAETVAPADRCEACWAAIARVAATADAPGSVAGEARP